MLKFSRRVMVACLGSLLAFGAAEAADWPQRPVAVVVSQAAGSSPDVLARIITDKLSRTLGQQFVVENRPGAGNVVGTQSVARANADGYTFLFGTSAALVTNPFTVKSLSYDPAKDFVAVSKVARSQLLLLVNPKIEAQNLTELLALEKKAPGTLSIAVDGPRNISGLIAQSINKQSGSKFVLVPYNNINNAVQDSITGRTPVTIQSASVVEAFIKDGSLRPIAVAGNKRVPSLPDVPSISETFNDINLQGWFMVMAPAGTPAPIVDRMSKAIAKALAEPDVLARAPTLGFEIESGDILTPAGAKAYLDAQLVSTGKVINSLGMEPN